jgi:hypothetical protein
MSISFVDEIVPELAVNDGAPTAAFAPSELQSLKILSAKL